MVLRQDQAAIINLSEWHTGLNRHSFLVFLGQFDRQMSTNSQRRTRGLEYLPMRALSQSGSHFLGYILCHQSKSQGCGLYWMSKEMVRAIVKDSLAAVPIFLSHGKVRRFCCNSRGKRSVIAVGWCGEIMCTRLHWKYKLLNPERLPHNSDQGFLFTTCDRCLCH